MSKVEDYVGRKKRREVGGTPSCLARVLLSLGVSCLLPNRGLWERAGGKGRSQDDGQAAKHPLPIFLGPMRSVEVEMARAPACVTWCQETPAHLSQSRLCDQCSKQNGHPSDL